MSKRAIWIGLLLGLGICATTYFNDRVMNQTQLIGNELPIGVFGPLILLLLVANPLMRLYGRNIPLRAKELGIIAVMGLVVCGWPGSGFFRTFTTSVVMPTHLERNNNAWKTAGVMSYVPGASAQIAPGQVLDWPKLMASLDSAASASSSSPGGHIWNLLPSLLQQRLAADQFNVNPGSEMQRLVLDGLNEIIAPSQIATVQSSPLWRQIEESSLPAAAQAAAGDYERLQTKTQSLTDQRDRIQRKAEAKAEAQQQKSISPAAASRIASLNRSIIYLQRQAEMKSQRANRAVLVEFAAGAIAASTPAEGLLLANGDGDPFVLDTLVRGWDGSHFLSPWKLPWRAWWPTLLLWGGLALLIGAISLCLVLIVHPQWSQRELLMYPIVRFVDELTVPGPFGWLPLIARNRLFWIGLSAVLSIHIVNGLHAWFPAVPGIPLSFNFWGLNSILPNVAKVDGSYGLFGPRLYLSIIAFSFFLSSEVSLSLGLSTFVWVFFGSILLRNGVPLANSGESVSLGAMIRAGAYLGSAVMILYVGRRYYLKLLGGMVGLPRHVETPAYAVWAARIAVLCTAAAVILLQVRAHLDWQIGVLVMALLILILLVMTRINVETGAFFIQCAWMPIAVLSGLLGMEGLGPEAFVVVAMISVIMVVDPRELITPFLANGLKMAEQVSDVPPHRSVRLIAIMVTVGFFVAMVATLTLQYNKGTSVSDGWARETVPSMPFRLASQELSVLSSQGSLGDAVQVHGWAHFTHAAVNTNAITWMGVGLMLVVLCTVARLRLPWWPLHPVIFLIWGTYAMAMTAVSFLIGWSIKASVVKFMGARGYRKVLPLMVGVIAGEVVAAIGWAGVGAIYYFITHITPANYSILPG